MGTNQKYSARIHSRRQLHSIHTHLMSCTNQLADVGVRYGEAAPTVTFACREMIGMLNMVATMVTDVRKNI
ncbi:unnamed protein product [marine sediment metagenome]|uniref:Uncharacterized protein n=1 Tax=marine sediment metagenome TaxID=412755 RepID=X1C101_9ZZZZ